MIGNTKKIEQHLPLIIEWIDNTLIRYSPESTRLIDLNFSRLPQYFSDHLLTGTKVVILDGVPPIPPFLPELNRLVDFFKGNLAGITYKDTYFVRRENARDESLHFHELIHIIQWEYLGIEKFIINYGIDLIERGYRISFLEEMAFRHQRRFIFESKPYDVEEEVLRELADSIS